MGPLRDVTGAGYSAEEKGKGKLIDPDAAEPPSPPSSPPPMPEPTGKYGEGIVKAVVRPLVAFCTLQPMQCVAVMLPNLMCGPIPIQV